MKQKVAPVLKASIRDDKTRGVKDIRAFLGSCNFYRRHIPTFTYSSHLLKDLTKKTVPWKWTPEHEAQFQEIKEKLSSLTVSSWSSLMLLLWEAEVRVCSGNEFQEQLQRE